MESLYTLARYWALCDQTKRLQNGGVGSRMPMRVVHLQARQSDLRSLPFADILEIVKADVPN